MCSLFRTEEICPLLGIVSIDYGDFQIKYEKREEIENLRTAVPKVYLDLRVLEVFSFFFFLFAVSVKEDYTEGKEGDRLVLLLFLI